MKARFPGLFVLLLLSSFSLFAQTARDSVTIEVVDVPVFVTRGDDPVEGLTRDDFELFVNGKRQAIEYFDVVHTGGEPVEPAATDSLRERRLFLLMFDLAFMPPHQLGRAQRAAAELIAKSPQSDLFAIATFSARRGVWFATPFTADRLALGRGLASLTTPGSGDPLGIVMTGAERAAMEPWSLDAPQISDALFRGAMIDRVAGEALRDMMTMQLRRAAEDQMIDFIDLATRLSALQGQKHVVLLSFGWDGSTGGASADFIRSTSFSVNDVTGNPRLPPHINLFDSTMLNHLRDMHEAFQRADILMHTLDMRGVAPLMGGAALYAYASGTGGTYLHNNNDLGGLLVKLSETYSTGYVLGFRPANAKRGHNKIEVKLKNKPRNTELSYRKGFTGTPPQLDVNEGLYLADVVLNDVPQTGTAASLTLVGDKLEVRVPLRPLSAQLGKAGNAELLIYIFGEDDVALHFHKIAINVPADATGEKAYALPLPEGATTAKALLRVDDALGFSKVGL